MTTLPERAPAVHPMHDVLDPDQDITRKEPIEIGWLLYASGPEARLEEAAEARRDVQDRLSNLFPDYHWVMPEARHELQDAGTSITPMRILERAERERDRHGWDFAIAITDLDLESYLKTYALGAPSQTLGVCVLSTARLDERAYTGPGSERAAELVQSRVAALSLHLFGDLNGVDHADDPSDYMCLPASVDDLDRMRAFGDGSIEGFRTALAAVADPRIEESSTQGLTSAHFYARAVWQNRRGVLESVFRARPWQFPFRLSKLTTAAASTMTVLLITAEAWELGMTQSPVVLTILSVLALLATSWFVLMRQRVLSRRQYRGLTEQRAVSEVSVVLAVHLGMLTTYVLLFLTTLLFSFILFEPAVVNEWTPSLDEGVSIGHYLILAGFVSMLGLAIGALGASFEANDYFRHIALIDEET